MQALNTQHQNFLILEKRKVQGVEAGAVVLCLFVTASTTVRARPGGYGGDVSAEGAEAPKCGAMPVVVGTGLGSTITAEAAAYANCGAMGTPCAVPISDCARRGSLLVVEGRYNAGQRVECGAYNCFHLTAT